MRRGSPSVPARRAAGPGSVPGLPGDRSPSPTTAWRWSSAGSRSGWSARRCAPRLSVARERAARDQPGERVRVLEQPLRPSARAHDAGVAPQRLARGARRRGGGRGRARSASSSARARRARAARGLRERVGDGAAGEHEALAERVGGEPVGAVQAGAGGLADRVEPGTRRAAVQVGDDAAHHVVGGRRDRDQLARRVEPRLAQRARRRWGSAPGRSRACRGRPSARRSRCRQLVDRARDLVAGGELVDEALAARRRAAWRPRRGSPR